MVSAATIALMMASSVAATVASKIGSISSFDNNWTCVTESLEKFVLAVEKEKKIENLDYKISDLHSEVIELAQQNSPHFYSRFLDLYPEFEKNILELSPKISISEIQFCALLKLNFSSKDIANYTFTSIRTVQNKKYRIRNKFNIPKEVDTYVFINNL